MNEATFAQIQTHVIDGSPGLTAERQKIAGDQGFNLSVDFLADLGLIDASAGERDPRFREGELNQPGTVEPVAAGASPLVRGAHHLERGGNRYGPGAGAVL